MDKMIDYRGTLSEFVISATLVPANGYIHIQAYYKCWFQTQINGKKSLLDTGPVVGTHL